MVRSKRGSLQVLRFKLAPGQTVELFLEVLKAFDGQWEEGQVRVRFPDKYMDPDDESGRTVVIREYRDYRLGELSKFFNRTIGPFRPAAALQNALDHPKKPADKGDAKQP